MNECDKCQYYDSIYHCACDDAEKLTPEEEAEKLKSILRLKSFDLFARSQPRAWFRHKTDCQWEVVISGEGKPDTILNITAYYPVNDDYCLEADYRWDEVDGEVKYEGCRILNDGLPPSYKKLPMLYKTFSQIEREIEKKALFRKRKLEIRQRLLEEKRERERGVSEIHSKYPWLVK